MQYNSTRSYCLNASAFILSHLPVLLLVFLLLFLLLTALLLGLLWDALVVSVLSRALQHLWTVGPHGKLLAVCKRPGKDKRKRD